VKIAFYGSSLLSSYWNGAATYYRGLLRALAALGHDITFYEPDAFDRQSHRDIEPPSWCRVVVYPATLDGIKTVLWEAAKADVVVKASGVGYGDDALMLGMLDHAGPDALQIWWDVDAPATLADIAASADHPLRAALCEVDFVLTYGGGDPVIDAYRALGAADCVPIYNALDPSTHYPTPVNPSFNAHLAFLGNRLPDREARVEEFFLRPAAALQDRPFLIGGAGWDGRPLPANVRYLGHVPSDAHNAFNVTPRAVININRASMAATGFSPPTRVFEAAGAGACLMTDDWEGIDLFLEPGAEVLVVRDGHDVVEALAGLTPERAKAIGQAALARVLREHTYDRRAAVVDGLLRSALAEKRSGVIA
jgi:spore maturation protein CgeB